MKTVYADALSVDAIAAMLHDFGAENPILGMGIVALVLFVAGPLSCFLKTRKL